jgi:hypothetical protein
VSANFTLAECLDYFEDVLETLRSGFAAMEDCAPKPVLRSRSGNLEVRYEHPSIYLAMFLKLARAISLLGGLRLMVQHGMVQEQGILQRAIDEADGDILCLSFGDQNGIEPIHEELLQSFWAEEFDDAENVLRHKRRRTVPRKRVEAYNSRLLGAGDPSTAQSVDRVIQGVYSGFVHGASTHILDLYDPEAKHFRIAGLGNTPVRRSYIIDATNYPYRVLMSALMVSRRLGLTDVAEGFYRKLKDVEPFIGLPSSDEVAQLVARMKGKR